MARRALLDLRMLTLPDGEVAAAWFGAWRYLWPRDASFVAAAYVSTGHRREAARVLHALQRRQRPDGEWEARYLLGRPGVPDDRPRQLDAVGWVPWAVWLWWRAGERGPGLEGLWSTVELAADAAARSPSPDGLPPAGPDYWESRAGEVTLGTAAPLLLGLRAAADLAEGTGRPGPAARWSAAAVRLQEALTDRFAAHGYPRTPAAGSGADAAVTWLAPPFAAADSDVAAAVRASARRLRLPGGGQLPGADWPGDRTVAWTPETAMFALAAASSGERRRAEAGLGWLERHRTRLGSLPEKVSDQGQPGSVAPLAWTAALVVLALRALEHPLPMPPDPG